MNRLTDNDKNWGPFTLARWSKTFSAEISSGCEEHNGTHALFVGFGWALRVKLPNFLKPGGKYGEHEREYGVHLSDMGHVGNPGYDFLQIHYGLQTMDSSTQQSWCCHLPWKQWDHVRHSHYAPDGSHYYTEPKGVDFSERYRIAETCPVVHFGFEDFDGELIVATCKIEEREWRKGRGWFKWLRIFYKPMIRRSLDLKFSAEVGCEKGSWKGGTIGTGTEMKEGDTPRTAFERYCQEEHSGRYGRTYRLRFIGPCEAPPPKVYQNTETGCNDAAKTV